MSDKKDTGMEKTARDNEVKRKEESGVTEETAPVGQAGEREQAEESAGRSDALEAAEELSEEEKLQNRVDELEDKLLRTMADFDNYKKRTANQYQELVRSANDRLICELLEVVDSLDRALHHTNDNSPQDAVRQGMEMIFNQTKGLLNKYGVKAIEAVGRPFDPYYHEALMQVESDEYDEGVVALEVKRGYTIGGRVVRYSKVGVSKGKGREEDAGEQEGQKEE